MWIEPTCSIPSSSSAGEHDASGDKTKCTFDWCNNRCYAGVGQHMCNDLSEEQCNATYYQLRDEEAERILENQGLTHPHGKPCIWWYDRVDGQMQGRCRPHPSRSAAGLLDSFVNKCPTTECDFR